MSDAEPMGAGGAFLSDQALNELGQDRLGHRIYVETLVQIIKSCYTPFTIGLLGKWGTGKTSIGRILLSEISHDEQLSRRFKTMEFDVWRYPGDSLRRRFLLDAVDCLVGEGAQAYKEKIRKALYESASEGRDSKWRFSVRKVWWFLPLLVGYVVLTAVFLFLASVYAPASADAVGVAAIAVTLILAVLGALDRLAEIGHSTTTTSLTMPPLHSPEQFEDQFTALLDTGGVSADPGGNKLVVIVDNLDRCDSQSAAEALKTVKTFFDQQGCIFVIPCDDQALMAHLKSTYGWEPGSEDAAEYLRKFFNTTLRIRPAVEDLTTLATELSLRLGFSEDVARVLWAAAPRDPRRIKEFLNRLLTARTIAELEQSRNRLSARVLRNLPFLAKVMVLEEKWPGFVDRVESDDSLLTRVGEALMNPDLLGVDTHVDLSEYLSDEPDSRYRGLEEFLRATSGVRAKDHRPFLSLRQYSYEVTIDETARLREDIRLGAFPRIGSAIGEADARQVTAIWQIICQVIGEERRAKREQTAIAGANAATELFDSCPEELKADAAAAITTTVCSFSSCLPDVLPRKVLNMLNRADVIWAQRVTDRMAESLRDTGPYLQDLLLCLPTHHPLFTEPQLRRIGAFLSERLGEDYDAVLEILEGLQLEDPGCQRLFAAEPQLLRALAAGLDASRIEQASRVATAYLRLADVAQEPARGEFVAQISTLLRHPISPPMGPQKELALSILDQVHVADVPEGQVDSLVAAILRAFDDVGKPEWKRRFLCHALRLRNKASDGVRGALDPKLQEAVAVWPPVEVGALAQLEQLTDSAAVAVIMRESLGLRILERPGPPENIAQLLDIREGLGPYLPGDDFGEYLGSLLGAANRDLVLAAVGRLQELYVSLDRQRQLSVLEQLRDCGRNMAVADKHIALKPLVELVRKTDSLEFRNGIGDDLVGLMKSSELDAANLGAQYYRSYRTKLSKDRRATIARELIDSLDGRRHDIDERSLPLVELAVDEANEVRVGQTAHTRLADLLLSLAQADKTEGQRSLGISSLTALKSLPRNRQAEIQEQLQTIAKDRRAPEALQQAAARAHARIFGPPGEEVSESSAASETEDRQAVTERLKPGEIHIASGTTGEFSEHRDGPWSPPVACDPIHDSWGSLEGAQWVWLRERPADEDAKVGQKVWHRLMVDLPVSAGRLDSASLQLMVDNVVHLHVNSDLVGTYEGFQSISHVDIVPYLRLGRNLIEMQVENIHGNAESTGESNPTGITYRLDVRWRGVHGTAPQDTAAADSS